MRLLLFFVILLSVFSSCSKKNRFSDVDLSNSPVSEVQIIRFDKDLLAVDTNNIAASLEVLREKHGDFADLFIKVITPPIYPFTEEELIHEFLTDPACRDFSADVQKKYTDVSDLEAGLTQAFKYINYHFPQIITPEIYAIVSGFATYNTEVMGNSILISLDYYLGADYENYKHLEGIPNYMASNFRREKIVSDAVFLWLSTVFPDNELETARLLDEMIYFGKIMYMTESFLPGEKEANLMGYTQEQLKWCRANEGGMWNYMVENKHLFSTDRLLITKYIIPAPFTAYFPEASPGRTGQWIGWQIVRAFMDKNKEVTLPELINNFNAQEILEKSGYQP